MNIAIYNGFYFHFEMFGYIIDYCNKKNIKLDIYTPLEIDLGWIKFYTDHLIKNNKINFIDVKSFPPMNDYDKIILTTDDDTSISDQIITDKYICIDHYINLRRPVVLNHISTRYFPKRPNLDWIIPVYRLINIDEKIKITRNNVICIGRSCPQNIESFKNKFDNFDNTNFIFIDRHLHNFQYIYEGYKNITCLNRLDTSDMIDLLKNSSYILITEENQDHIDKSMSASIPLAFSCMCNLIMPEKMNEHYNFKSVITYSKKITLTEPNFKLINKELDELLNRRDTIFNKYIKKDLSPWTANMIVYAKSEKRYNNALNMQKIMPNLQLFEAFDSINEYEKFKEIAINNNFFTPKYLNYCNMLKGKLGCAMSHITVMYKFLKYSNKNWLLVLEDDIELNNYNEFIINDLIGIAEKVNSNYIQLFTNKKYINIQIQQPKLCLIKNKLDTYGLFKMIPQWGGLAYLINKKAIQFILSQIPFDDNNDVIISKYVNELNSLCLLNNLIINKGADDANDKSSEFGSLLWS
jgi:GR25 family glycosyltransferase involved in LPS biosynthesis